jgi:hypothetical protein
VATFCLGLSQQLRLGDQLTTAHRCVGRLRSLDTIIMTLSRSCDEIAAEYAELEQAFPEYCQPPRWPHRAPTAPWPPPLPLHRP